MEKPMKVMLAEEGSEYGQTCANVLRSYGYEVTLVPKDGSEVISRLPIHTPDVLLMDMFMPHVDALGVMKALPELKLSKRPLIMLTSSVDNARFEQEVLAAGADYYFLKPFDLDILAERISQLTGWRRTYARFQAMCRETWKLWYQKLCTKLACLRISRAINTCERRSSFRLTTVK